MRACADSNLKKVSLELGGKSPLILFADCDMDKAVKNALGYVDVLFRFCVSFISMPPLARNAPSLNKIIQIFSIFSFANLYDFFIYFEYRSVFFNKGENCIAAGRLFVEETIYDEFLERVVVETKKMKIGDPLDRFVQFNLLIMLIVPLG